MQDAMNRDLCGHVSARFSELIDDGEGMKKNLFKEFSALVQDQAKIKCLIHSKLKAFSGGLDRQDLVSLDVIIAKGDRFAISVRVATPCPKGPLVTSQDLMFCATLNDQPLQWRSFSANSHFDLNVYNPDIRLIESDFRKSAPGEIVVFDDPVAIYDVDITSETLLIRLVVTPPVKLRATQGWTFSRELLAPVGTSASHFRDTSMILTAGLLGEIGDESSISGLQVMAKNSSAHFVRWASIKAIAAIDADQAIEAAEWATKDEHPHIREAAEIVVHQLRGI